ncbi:RipA family octameric membrane protein [Bacteroides pyogenes]|uniref:ABC transporter ATP-binding protein n=1 Tax=Bacteroides pyogenes TaxID=310300 RepID=A0A5D3EF12_9BACE|nr:ABC transporter ATP-binding protein [Bacteroides pyogenes]TYK34050.1 ABC transporter ATP-binding protein [Bacteroides pyogenes]TYK47636.1 ABC transporter ATP-binding protein [Bacteroides pyogenes]
MCQNKFKKIEKEKRKLAFEKAHEIRKFEIGLYWKRATYFWAFIASAFVAYIAVISSKNEAFEDKDNYAFIITCIGLIFSFSWYLVNRASKHWQTNWEKIIDDLEDEFTGDLMKRHIKNNNKWYELTLSYRFSVSRINQIISLFITVIWFIFLCSSGYKVLCISTFSLFGSWLLPIFSFVTLIFIVVLIKYGISGKPEEKVSLKPPYEKRMY